MNCCCYCSGYAMARDPVRVDWRCCLDFFDDCGCDSSLSQPTGLGSRVGDSIPGSPHYKHPAQQGFHRICVHVVAAGRESSKPLLHRPSPHQDDHYRHGFVGDSSLGCFLWGGCGCRLCNDSNSDYRPSPERRSRRLCALSGSCCHRSVARPSFDYLLCSTCPYRLSFALYDAHCCHDPFDGSHSDCHPLPVFGLDLLQIPHVVDNRGHCASVVDSSCDFSA